MLKVIIILLFFLAIIPVYSQIIEPTPLVAGSGGYVWMDPDNKKANVSAPFTWEVHANTENQRLAAYEIDISWPVPRDGVIMTVDTSIGTNGVEPGTEGFVASVSVDNAMGTISISGFDTTGTGPSTNLHVCTINFIAGSREALNIAVSVNVDVLVDENTSTIGLARGLDAVINIKEIYFGDVNEDGAIDIIDALLVVQYYVGLNPVAFTAPLETGDSNQDGDVNVIDALMMAQYYVGICNCPYFPPL